MGTPKSQVEALMLMGRGMSADTFKNVSALVVTSEQTVWTPASGKKVRLQGFCLTQGVATGAITLRDGSGGSTILTIPQHTVGAALWVDLDNGILLSAADRVLTAQGASTETITGFFYGTEEA